MNERPHRSGLVRLRHVHPTAWQRAALEKGMTAMEGLLAATRNVAIGYGMAKDLGTLERGKRADLVILDADPLADPANYVKVSAVYKDGLPVDRAKLPVKRIITAEQPK